MHQCEEAWEKVWRGIEGQPVDMGEYNCRYPSRYDSHTWATPKFHSRSRFLVLKLMDALSYQGCQVTPLGRYPTTDQVPSGHILHAKNSGVTHTCTHDPVNSGAQGLVVDYIRMMYIVLCMLLCMLPVHQQFLQ